MTLNINSQRLDKKSNLTVDDISERISRGNSYRAKTINTFKSKSSGDKVVQIQYLLTKIVAKNIKKIGS